MPWQMSNRIPGHAHTAQWQHRWPVHCHRGFVHSFRQSIFVLIDLENVQFPWRPICEQSNDSVNVHVSTRLVFEKRHVTLTSSNSLDKECSARPLCPKYFRRSVGVLRSLRKRQHPRRWHCRWCVRASGDFDWSRPVCADAWSMHRLRLPKRWMNRAMCSQTIVCKCRDLSTG